MGTVGNVDVQELTMTPLCNCTSLRLDHHSKNQLEIALLELSSSPVTCFHLERNWVTALNEIYIFSPNTWIGLKSVVNHLPNKYKRCMRVQSYACLLRRKLTPMLASPVKWSKQAFNPFSGLSTFGIPFCVHHLFASWGQGRVMLMILGKFLSLPPLELDASSQFRSFGGKAFKGTMWMLLSVTLLVLLWEKPQHCTSNLSQTTALHVCDAWHICELDWQ